MNRWNQQIVSLFQSSRRRRRNRFQNFQTEALETRILPATFVISSPAEDASVGPELQITYDGSRHHVSLTGTSQTDYIVVAVDSSTPRITLNQTNYVFPAGVLTNPKIDIDGGDGADHLKINLGDQPSNSFAGWANIINMYPGNLDVDGGGYNIESVGTEYQQVVGGAGRESTAMWDSTGNEVFAGRSDVAWMTGAGFSNVMRNAEVYTAHSTGGSDLAQVSVSGNVIYQVEGPDMSFTAGDQQYHAVGFSETTAYFAGVNIGHGLFYDTSPDANNVFEASPSTASFTGAGYHHVAHGLPHVVAETGGGGTAILHDSPGNDDFSVTPSSGRARIATRDTNSYSATALGFENNIGYASAGVDYANLFDSAGDDTLVATETYAVLRGGGYYAQASGFDVRDVITGNGGNDVAHLVDSTGHDLVTVGTIATANQGSSKFASISHDVNGGNDSTQTFARGFSKVVVIGNSGGQNDIDWYGSLGFNFQRVGAWNIT